MGNMMMMMTNKHALTLPVLLASVHHCHHWQHTAGVDPVQAVTQHRLPGWQRTQAEAALHLIPSAMQHAAAAHSSTAMKSLPGDADTEERAIYVPAGSCREVQMGGGMQC
jgi:hypothetical protein